MSIQYVEPLERSWSRARQLLFRPFRLELWLVLGFAAFLSNLGQGGGGLNGAWRSDRESFDGIGRTLHEFLHKPWVLGVFVVVFFTLVILGVVLAWVSARGRFIFLDDVLHERAAIVEPWTRFARLGNSLFVFQLLVGLGAFVLFLILFGPTLLSLLRAVWDAGTLPEIDWLGLMLRGLLGAPLFLSAAVLHVLTRQFVVPVMWKHDLGALAAWKRFLPLLGLHPGAFLVFLLFLLALWLGVGIAVLVFGFITCCFGFLLLALPYVGSVVLLPVHVTFRGLGPEFLSQFGPEWDARPRRGE